MGNIHADPKKIRRLASRKRSFTEAFRERHERIRSMLSQLNDSWRDDRFIEFAEEITHDLNQMRRIVSQIEMLAERIELLAPPLEDYLTEEVKFDELEAYPKSRTSPSANNRPLNGVTSDQGHSLTLLPVSNLSVKDIEWGDPDFDRSFRSDTHHGYTGQDYLDFVSHLPEVLEHVKEGGNFEDWPSGSVERACHSAFLRKQVIRLDRTPEGKIDVIEGRHRLYACIQLGIDPPVCWVGTNNYDSSTQFE